MYTDILPLSREEGGGGEGCPGGLDGEHCSSAKAFRAAPRPPPDQPQRQADGPKMASAYVPYQPFPIPSLRPCRVGGRATPFGDRRMLQIWRTICHGGHRHRP